MTLTPQQFRAIRQLLGRSLAEWYDALGTGNASAISKNVIVTQWESEARSIPEGANAAALAIWRVWKKEKNNREFLKSLLDI